MAVKPEDRLAAPPFIVQVGSRYVIRMPKAGFTTVQHAINEWKAGSQRAGQTYANPTVGEEPLLDLPVLVNLRHPEDRLISAWRFIGQPLRGGKPSRRQWSYRHNRQFRPAHQCPPFEQFVEELLAVPDSERDIHVRSQWRSCCWDYDAENPVMFLPTQIFRWDFAGLLEALGLENDGQVYNPTASDRPRPQLGGDLRRRFREDYWRDIEMFEGALAD